MSEVNTTPTQADLATWFKMSEELTKLKVAESLLRKRLFDHFFKDPKEGTNDYPLDEGYVLKGQRIVNRKVVEADLEALKDAIRADGSNLPKLPINKLVKYKVELVKSEYNKLSDEDKKIFDRALEIKDGSPSMDIVKPKRA